MRVLLEQMTGKHPSGRILGSTVRLMKHY